MSYESSDFKSGEDLFVYFKSPISGYLNIFLLDYGKDESYCLLPYKNAKRGSYKIESDKDYIFFSPDNIYEQNEKVDEIILKAENARDLNDIIVVFSPNEFSKLSLNVDKSEKVPKYTSIEKFNKWLSKLKRSNDCIIESKHNIIIYSYD